MNFFFYRHFRPLRTFRVSNDVVINMCRAALSCNGLYVKQFFRIIILERLFIHSHRTRLLLFIIVLTSTISWWNRYLIPLVLLLRVKSPRSSSSRIPSGLVMGELFLNSLWSWAICALKLMNDFLAFCLGIWISMMIIP